MPYYNDFLWELKSITLAEGLTRLINLDVPVKASDYSLFR